MRLGRLVQSMWIARWWEALCWLAAGVRIHPTTCLTGNLGRIRIQRGSKIGSNCLIDVGSSGRLVMERCVWLSKDIVIETTTVVSIGEGTTIQRRCTINGSSRLGANCILAPNVFISSGTHPFRFLPHLTIREQERRVSKLASESEKLDREVWIQDDCWLGANVVVCPGVTIGKGCVVGANSVVTHDVAPYTVVAGLPAKPIGLRMQWIPKSTIYADNEADHPYILSGRLVISALDKKPWIEVNTETPVLAALALPRMNEHLFLDWSATAPVQIEVCGHSYSLAQGDGQLIIPNEQLTVRDQTVYCLITLSDEVEKGTLLVSRLYFTGQQVAC